MAQNEDTEWKLLRLMLEYPGQGRTTNELVRASGVTRQRVHQILKALGYEVRCVWVKKGSKR